VRSRGLEDLKFHELRHMIVAFWIRAEANLKEVVRAGHSSVAFTLDRYGHRYEVAEDEIPEHPVALFNAHAASQASQKVLPMARSQRMLVDLRFCGWPQRDLNPCYRLERAAS
jgi:hypothetical protein